MYRLLTSEQEAELRANGMRTDGGDEIDPNPVVKLFTLNGQAIWLLTELSPFYEGLAFGLCDWGLGEPELGNVYLPEIEALKHETLGIPLVERDDAFKASHPLSVFAECAGHFREIVEDDEQLQLAVKRIEIKNRLR